MGLENFNQDYDNLSNKRPSCLAARDDVFGWCRVIPMNILHLCKALCYMPGITC